MIERKNPKLDVKNYRGLFFNVGLAIAFGLVLTAFEWKTVEPTTTVDFDDDIAESTLIMEPPATAHVPPPPPKVQNPVIIERPDEVEIEEEFLVKIDVDVSEDNITEVIFDDKPKAEEVEVVFDRVEQYPEFMNGGQEAFLKYVGSQLEYPARARRLGIEGKVFVRFIVDKNGRMTDIEVVKGIGAGCDEEVLRVLNAAPKWEPGKQRGVPVKVRMIVPVTFRLN